MNEELKFHFPIATLLRDGDAIYKAAVARPELNPRLADDLLTQTGALLLSVPAGDAAQKSKRGGVGTLTQTQDALFRQLNKKIAAARRTAALAFPGQTVKLHEEFQVGANDKAGLGDVLQRARIIIASLKKTENLGPLKAKGWIEADTTAMETILGGLTVADQTQETGKGGAKGATGTRNHDANQLYDNILALQNAADLQWPDDNPANVAVRAEFRLDTFPPRGGKNGGDEPTPPAPPTPPPA